MTCQWGIYCWPSPSYISALISRGTTDPIVIDVLISSPYISIVELGLLLLEDDTVDVSMFGRCLMALVPCLECAQVGVNNSQVVRLHPHDAALVSLLFSNVTLSRLPVCVMPHMITRPCTPWTTGFHCQKCTTYTEISGLLQ